MEHLAADKPGYRELLDALRALASGMFPESDSPIGEGRQAGTRTFIGDRSLDPVSAMDKIALMELVPASTAFILATLITDGIDQAMAGAVGMPQ